MSRPDTRERTRRAARDRQNLYTLVIIGVFFLFIIAMFMKFHHHGRLSTREEHTAITPPGMPAPIPSRVSRGEPPRQPPRDGAIPVGLVADPDDVQAPPAGIGDLVPDEEEGDDMPLKGGVGIGGVADLLPLPDPPQPYQWDVEEVLGRIQDKTIEVEDDAIAYLLHKLRTTPHDAPERLNAPWVTQTDLVARSEELRGAWVHIIGDMYRLYEPREVRWPGPSGVYVLYESVVFCNDIKAVRIFTVDREPLFEKRQAVQTRGLFYKFLAYQIEDGSLVAAPVVIAERLEAYEAPPREPSFLWGTLVPLLLMLVGLALVFVMIVGGMRGFGRRRQPLKIRRGGAAAPRDGCAKDESAADAPPDGDTPG